MSPYWRNCQISRASVIFARFENRSSFVSPFRAREFRRYLGVGKRKMQRGKRTSEPSNCLHSRDVPLLFGWSARFPLRATLTSGENVRGISRRTRSVSPANKENRSHLVHTDAPLRTHAYACGSTRHRRTATHTRMRAYVNAATRLKSRDDTAGSLVRCAAGTT